MWFRTIVSELRRANMRMARPYGVHSRLIRMESNMLVYAVTAGPAADPDVVTRRFTATVNGEQQEPRDFPVDATLLGEFKANQGDLVVLSLVDIDDAGNFSEPAVVEFQAVDTIPPAAPGSFGVELLREEA